MKLELSYTITYQIKDTTKEEHHGSVLIMDFDNHELGSLYLRKRVQEIVNDIKSNGHYFVKSEEETKGA